MQTRSRHTQATKYNEGGTIGVRELQDYYPMGARHIAIENFGLAILVDCLYILSLSMID
jgi:hypothetical protein